MARVIANEEIWVGFATSVASISAPTDAEVAGATDLTSFLISLDATTRGNQIPTPNFDTLFETSIPGTVSASFSAEFYRDDATDTAWTTLPRATEGYFIISRFGTDGALPTSGNSDTVDVWHVRVTARSPVTLSNNDTQRFQIECAVITEPTEDVSVVV